MKFLNIMKKNKYDIVNIDVTILLQKPKLRDHIDKMRKTIAEVTDTEVASISVKATTTEGLGFVGREEGVAAHCVCLLKK